MPFNTEMLERYARLLRLGLVGALAIIMLTIALLTLLIYLWRKSIRRRAVMKHFQQTHQPDGTPYPPAGRGMCDKCQQAAERVYVMPDNRRLCPACYLNAEGFRHQRKKQKN